MPAYAELESVLTKLKAALEAADSKQIGQLSEKLKGGYPFIYAMLGDALEKYPASLALSLPNKSTVRERVTTALQARIASIPLWAIEGNKTVAAIDAGKIDPAHIKPHIRRTKADYDEFYNTQSDSIGKTVPAVSKRAGKEPRPFMPLKLTGNINNAFRRAHVVQLVEVLFGLAAARTPQKRIRWLDIGCGIGDFANAVNPQRFGARQFDIVGCDFQAGKIASAEAFKAQNRQFVTGDAYEILTDAKNRGEKFDIGTMFEFLEHLEDPLKFLEQLQSFEPMFVYAASPRRQKLPNPFDATPDKVHLWSYSREAWEAMFRSVGLNPVYSSEVCVGDYIGGLDWLGMVCGPVDEMKGARLAWGGEDGKARSDERKARKAAVARRVAAAAS